MVISGGFTEALNHTSTYTFDGNGNLLTVGDPLGHVETWTYDAFNNVTSYTDAEVPGNVTDYHYEESGYPTLLTKIVEPESGKGVRMIYLARRLAPRPWPPTAVGG